MSTKRLRMREPTLCDALERAYAAPPRAYHHFGHIDDVLARATEVPTYRSWPAVELAVLFHDAVYVPGRSDNEIESAALCRKLVPKLSPGRAAHVDEACALILLTAGHGSYTREELTDDARHFLDADMAILGAPAALFAAYDAAIREEHKHVDSARYARGRAGFLRHMLGLPRIYLSDAFFARYEARARENLSRALAQFESAE